MAKLLKLRGGTTSQHGSFTGADREVTVDTDKETLVVHNGSQAGGFPLARADGTGTTNFTITGELDCATLDVSGNADIDGTLEADAITINGVTLAETISDTVGAMVSGNTESNITVTYQDGDNTLDFSISSSSIRSLVESASDSNVFTDADHSKLDGIEASATADQTASEILTLIKTVDGSGSGLDADTLDGVSGENFLRSNTGDTASGDITFTGGAGAAFINGGSDIRFSNGSWTGDFGAKIQNHSNQLYIQYGNSGMIMRSAAGSNRFTLDNSGNAVFSGNVTAFSDERLKTDIQTIDDALDSCGQLRGVSFKWIEDNKPSIGVIAQEVEKVIPEIVMTNESTDPATNETTETKSVDYGKMVGVLINAINELKAEVDELKRGK